MTARTDLIQKPYPVEAAMKYEDEVGTAVRGQGEYLSIPVRQKASFGTQQEGRLCRKQFL